MVYIVHIIQQANVQALREVQTETKWTLELMGIQNSDGLRKPKPARLRPRFYLRITNGFLQNLISAIIWMAHQYRG